MLDPSTLAYLRADQATTLTERGTVKRMVMSDDGMGGQRATLTTIATYPCRRAPSNYQPVTREQAERVTLDPFTTIRLPVDADVQTGDTITVFVTSYTVAAVQQRTNETVRTVQCTEG